MATIDTQRATPRRWTRLLSVLLLIGLLACGQGPQGTDPTITDPTITDPTITDPTDTDPTVTGVSVAPDSLQLIVGETAMLTATVTATGTADRSVTWSSGDESIASVDESGNVTGLATGSTSITATSNHDQSRFASAEAIVSSSGWTRQFGTSAIDMGEAVAVDLQGFLIVVGSTTGDLNGRNAGDYDAFVGKFTPDGDEVWVRQFGTAGRDQALAVATDHGNNIIVTGTTEGNLAGPNAGGADVFVRQYTPDGEVVWTEQFGTARRDGGTAVAVDASGNILVAGDSAVALTGRNITGAEGFVRRYKPNPGRESVTEDWTHYTDTFIDGLAVDADGNVFVVGSQRVARLGSEVYILKLSPAGAVQWSTLFGTGKESQEQGGERDAVPATRRPGERWANLRGFEDVGSDVAVDASGSIFVTGYVGGFQTGTVIANPKAYLLKLTPAGDEEWALLFDDTYPTFGNGIVNDGDGNLIVIGNTASFYDRRSPPGTEMFTRKFAPDGTLIWVDTFGDTGLDMNRGVATGAYGSIFIVGYTLGDLDGTNLGRRDAFLRKYVP